MPYYLKEFDPETDYDTCKAWWQARALTPLPKHILPKLGVMALPAPGAPPDAAAWLYMDNSVGVCFLEGTVTRPGLDLHTARAAIGAVVEFLRQSAAAMDYATMITFTGCALAREARRHGFTRVGSELSMLVATLKEATPCQQSS